MRYLIVLSLAGCASTSAIVPFSEGIYRITARDDYGFAAREELQGMAAKEATAYCIKQGQVMQAQLGSARGDAWEGTIASLYFKCVEK